MKNLKYILSPYSMQIYSNKYCMSENIIQILHEIFLDKIERIEVINWDIECQIRNEIIQKENRNTFF